MNNSGPLAFLGTLILPERILRDGVVLCDDGRITAVGPRDAVRLPDSATRIEVPGGFIAPGYVDIHVHGGGGADFMDGTREAVLTATRAHARHGTTSIFPTTTTGTRSQIDAMLRAARAARDEWRIGDGARVAGVHFYGPYFAEDKIGCHPKYGRRDPDAAEYLAHFDLGIVRVATCAAELPGAEDFYREAARRGYLVTCGHSNASWTEMAAAFRAGMRHVDHFWSAMSSVPSMRARFGTPMQGSMEQFVLRYEDMSTEVIADGFHLSPELLDFAFALKGPRRLCLVTDSNRALDMPPGPCQIGPKDGGEWVISNGKVGVTESGGLASSIVGMDTMVQNMNALTSAGIVNAVRMASLTPAERVGLATEIGSLAAGKRADVLCLDAGLGVTRTFIEGREFKSGKATAGAASTI